MLIGVEPRLCRETEKLCSSKHSLPPKCTSSGTPAAGISLLQRRTRRAGHVALLSNRDKGDSGSECGLAPLLSGDTSLAQVLVGCASNPTTTGCGAAPTAVALLPLFKLAIVASSTKNRQIGSAIHFCVPSAPRQLALEGRTNSGFAALLDIGNSHD